MDTSAETLADEQTLNAEWMALHEQVDVARKRVETAEGMVSYYFAKHLENGGFKPGPLGVPDFDAVRDYTFAASQVDEVKEQQAEVARLRTALEEHPYTAIVAARTEARLAEQST